MSRSKAMTRKANRQNAERRRLEAERQHALATVTDPVQLGLVTAYYTRQLRGFVPIRDLPGHYLYQLGLTRQTWEPTEAAQDHPPVIHTRRN